MASKVSCQHVAKKGKPLLYLVFEYLDTDLKKFIDNRHSVNAGPLPPNVIQCNKEEILSSDLRLKKSKQPTEFFCNTLTASDTSTHGGFSIPRRATEKVLPPLDFSMQPPTQEVVARELHYNVWIF